MADLTVSEVLSKAAALIEPEGAWGRNNYASDTRGEVVVACSPRAVCWCASGAIVRATGSDDAFNPLAMQARLALRDILGEGSIPAWNDARGRTQAEVVSALREAAKLAEASL